MILVNLHKSEPGHRVFFVYNYKSTPASLDFSMFHKGKVSMSVVKIGECAYELSCYGDEDCLIQISHTLNQLQQDLNEYAVRSKLIVKEYYDSEL